MMKEMNHRFGFYFLSAVMIIMLVLIYLDVQNLSREVNEVLQSAGDEVNQIQVEPSANQQPVNSPNLDILMEAESPTPISQPPGEPSEIMQTM
jgi:hypothetical protein